MNGMARKWLCGLAAAGAIALAGTSPASADLARADDHVTTQDDNGDNGLWGLLGLVGLLGLAGLVRRGPKADAMAGYPAAPPANAYPPAEPRRSPPGV
ncbi:WGxxGxxG-CTERM domain-containing protein [Amycolatopsis sp. FBCC-B4732]|uniref:WGxxGxxG family protein n=1 Tax=Amycolatopsis sp. FBCC-B4732 TaxID=3079339 RepID=UPI001FF58A0E|nr:WGxxGxxG family protein [Amycolatopsis sp. FBCC-B4732]UOX92638.1 WGxxGxxG-CTERM domain-containing protein [Amycolatopsis sp. FBCC-B4732]